jgi:hypothetical protein
MSFRIRVPNKVWRAFATSFVMCGLSASALCQNAAVFSSYQRENRYDFNVTPDQLEKTLAWQDSDPNPTLSVRQAKLVGTEYLKQLFDDADKWTLNAITLHPLRDRWVYTISFTEPPPPGCMDCFSIPFNVVVTMDGFAVPARISPSKPAMPRSSSGP